MRLKVSAHRQRREFAATRQCNWQEQLIGQMLTNSNRSRQIGASALSSTFRNVLGGDALLSKSRKNLRDCFVLNRKRIKSIGCKTGGQGDSHIP